MSTAGARQRGPFFDLDFQVSIMNDHICLVAKNGLVDNSNHFGFTRSDLARDVAQRLVEAADYWDKTHG